MKSWSRVTLIELAVLLWGWRIFVITTRRKVTMMIYGRAAMMRIVTMTRTVLKQELQVVMHSPLTRTRQKEEEVKRRIVMEHGRTKSAQFASTSPFTIIVSCGRSGDMVFFNFDSGDCLGAMEKLFGGVVFVSPDDRGIYVDYDAVCVVYDGETYKY